MVSMPVVARGPWTRERRELAAAAEARDAFIRYFHLMMKERNWLPWDDLPLEEMRELGHRLSDDTVKLIEAFYGLESQVGNYVADGLDMLHKMRERRNLHLAWGSEELKHSESFELVLEQSERRTKAELEAYRAASLTRRWRMRDEHPDLDNPLGFICYGLMQERVTFYNYDEMRKRIRSEYGIAAEPSAEERERGVEIGAAGAFARVANDERAHYDIFLEMVKIYLRYLPKETLDTLQRVVSTFSTPALRLLPDPAQLTETFERTLFYTPLKYVRNVRNVVLDALGFESKRALDAAAEAARHLSDTVEPDSLTITRDGRIVALVADEGVGR
jgi:acyl-[acyl-carrier-protein] desaturase